MLSALVIVVITAARFFNIDLDSGMLTELVSAVSVLVSAIVIWYQRTTLVKAADGFGDVNLAGISRG